MTGRFVISTAGRDRGHVFLVIGSESEYLILADGCLRKINKPKKKKLKHTRPLDGAIGLTALPDTDRKVAAYVAAAKKAAGYCPAAACASDTATAGRDCSVKG